MHRWFSGKISGSILTWMSFYLERWWTVKIYHKATLRGYFTNATACLDKTWGSRVHWRLRALRRGTVVMIMVQSMYISTSFLSLLLAKATAFSIGTIRILVSLQNILTNLISEISSLHHYKTYQAGNIKLAYKLLLLTMLTEFLQNYLSVSKLM